MRDLFRVGALGGSRALAAVIGFLAVWQIADRLGPDALGVWSMALACLGFALHVSEFGLRSVATAEAGAHHQVWRALLWRYLALRLSIAVAVAGATLALTFLLWPDGLQLMGILLLVIFAIGLHLDWVALVHDRPLIAGRSLLVKPFAFSLILWSVPVLDTPAGVALALAGAWWLSAIATWPQFSLVAPIGPAPRSVPGLLGLGLPLMGNTLVNQMQLSLDLLLVGLIAGTTMAGHYYLAAAIVAAGLVFANATGQIATARMARFRDDSVAFARELRRQLSLTAAIALGLATLLVVAAPPVIPLLFGAEFAPTGGLIGYFVPWFILAGISAHLQGALTAHLQQKLITKSNLALLGTLAPALGLAWAIGEPAGFALARALGEGARIAVLVVGSQLAGAHSVAQPS